MLDRAVDLYFDAGLAQSATRTYAAGIKKYLTLYQELRITPTPTSEQLLCRFMSSLAESNTSHDTIKVYLAAAARATWSPDAIGRSHAEAFGLPKY